MNEGSGRGRRGSSREGWTGGYGNTDERFWDQSSFSPKLIFLHGEVANRETLRTVLRIDEELAEPRNAKVLDCKDRRWYGKEVLVEAKRRRQEVSGQVILVRFKEQQDRLQQRVGRNVRLVSCSIYACDGEGQQRESGATFVAPRFLSWKTLNSALRCTRPAVTEH